MQIVFAVGLVVAIAILIFGAVSKHRKKNSFLALCEYWVYIEGDAIPKQEVLMDRMISANPHNRPGKPSIGAREGMLFTDIRLHVALAKKSKNPLVFRPDLFESDLEIDKVILDRLTAAQSLIKVRYISDIPLSDTRHLQFVPHMADAMSDLTNALLVYDVVTEQIYKAEAFTKTLADNNNAERSEAHVRVVWVTDQIEGTSFGVTKGLRKNGVTELKTDPVDTDKKTLVITILENVAKTILKGKKIEEPFEIKEFDDTYLIELLPESTDYTKVSIKKIVN